MILFDCFDLLIFEDQQDKMAAAFKAAMSKLAVIGHDPSEMVDCSEVIPTPKPFTGQAVFPAGLSNQDIEQAVRIIFLFFC